jgi:hypothetical protein
MMVMRIATFDQKPDVDEAKHEAFRQWMGSQPGMLGGWHLRSPEGAYISVSLWASREDLLAMRDRQYPGGPLGLKPDRVQICDVVSAFGP